MPLGPILLKTSIWFISVKLDLGHMNEVLFAGFLHIKLPFYPSCSVHVGRKSFYKTHSQRASTSIIRSLMHQRWILLIHWFAYSIIFLGMESQYIAFEAQNSIWNIFCSLATQNTCHIHLRPNSSKQNKKIPQCYTAILFYLWYL